MKRGYLFRWTKHSVWIGILVLAGCAKYRPEPLPTAPDLARVPALEVPAKQFWLPGLAPHPLPKNGLDETAVITLAVFNNPGLKAARLQAGIASAQLLQAGLLPDPQLGVGPQSSALNYGGTVGLSEDIQALITRGAAQAAARAHQQQVNLDILWQEWQVAEKARELFIEVRTDGELQNLLNATRNLFAERYRQDRAAMEKGYLTVETPSADLALLADADTRLRQLQLEFNLTRHELNGLLGLQPDVEINLTGPIKTALLSQTQFEAALAALPRHRVDLLALQAGYESQEQSLREAILAQFPLLSARVEQSRDPVEGVNSVGFNVNLTLPLFNRNRGQIAVQRATRAVLHQAYQVQLDMAESQADQVWKAARIMARQLHDLDKQLSSLEKSANEAEQSFRENNVNAGLYVSVKSSFLSKQAEAVRLRASLEKAQSALSILLGLPFTSP